MMIITKFGRQSRISFEGKRLGERALMCCRFFVLLSFLLPPATLGDSGQRDWVDASGQSRPFGDLELIIRGHELFLLTEGEQGSRADLSGSTLIAVDMRGANLEKAKLQGANLEDANLHGARLDEADLSGSVLRGANLAFAKFNGADLQSAILAGAMLDGAEMSAINAKNAQFQEASIRYTWLNGAHLEGADLSTVRWADHARWVDGVYFDSSTRWPTGFKPSRYERTEYDFGQENRLFYVGTSIIFGATLIMIIIQWLFYTQKRRSIEMEIETKEASDDEKESLPDYVCRVLSLAISRQRLLMLSAERRSTTLHRLATTLMVLAVFAPLAAWYVYVEDDPTRTIDILTEKGYSLDGITSIPNRDWHLLGAGLSFGFLFLAAARGIGSQEARQRTTYFQVGERVSQYGDMEVAIRIASRMEAVKETELIGLLLRRLLIGIIDKTEARGAEASSDEENRESSDSHWSLRSELKNLGDIFK